MMNRKYYLLGTIGQLNEVQLSATEILKPNSMTGEPRWQILYQKIMNGEPLELKDGTMVTIDAKLSNDAVVTLRTGDEDYIKRLFSLKGNAGQVFVATNGIKYSLTSFKKTQDFGGGSSGSGAGAEQTTLQEAAQCVALAILVKKNKTEIIAGDLTLANAREAQSKYHISTKLEDIVKLFGDKKWNESLVITTNQLVKKFPEIKKLEFHHQSDWVKSLEATFNLVNRAENKYFSNINKWNPSDIWCVKKGLKAPKGEVANTLVELNAWLQEYYEQKQCYGVSLKKVGKTATIKVYNDHEDVDELLDITIKKLLISKSNELFGSKDGNIIFESTAISPLMITEAKPKVNDITPKLKTKFKPVDKSSDGSKSNSKGGEVQFRSFGGDDPIQGEIKGKLASHGKVGHGPINKILSRMGLRMLTDRIDIYNLRDRTSKSKAKQYAPVVQKIIANARIVNKQVADEASTKLTQISKEIEHNVLISKFQAVELLAIIKKATEEQRETFIQELIGMASSRTELSSVFIKVY